MRVATALIAVLCCAEWINMPDSTGFGSYSESGTVIPCTIGDDNKPINFALGMFLDSEVWL